MAVSWWMATGTYQKMERDVRYEHSGPAYWTPQHVQGMVPLNVHHVLPSFMLIALGTFTYDIHTEWGKGVPRKQKK